MNSEYLYPGLLDRDSRDDWERKGARDIREAARERARKVLAEHWPEVIPGDLDAEIRRRFEILLQPQAMRPARSEEHTSELKSLMRISYAVFCLKKKK